MTVIETILKTGASISILTVIISKAVFYKTLNDPSNNDKTVGETGLEKILHYSTIGTITAAIFCIGLLVIQAIK